MREEILAIQNRLEWLLPKENLGRIRIKSKKGVLIYADVHNMNCRQADRFISNLIAIIRQQFRLRIIHGFNNGTAIKQMFNTTYHNIRIDRCIPNAGNPGITEFFIH